MPNMKFSVQSGSFVKHCPCSPETVSCGYYNINLHTGCPFSCNYCILKSYLTTTEPVFYTNFNDLAAELDSLQEKQKNIRLGTGELADSLAYDGETGYSNRLIDVFRNYPDMVLELKTKSVCIENLLAVRDVPPNVVVAWSMNPAEIVIREELYTPLLQRRIAALEAVQEKGYKVAVHFDPIIAVPGWQELYDRLIRALADAVCPERLAWWSLGALRFPQDLREHILQKKESQLFFGELVKGYDGKYRYFKPLRIQLFSHIKSLIRERFSRELPLYLCMEDADTWKKIFPEFPAVEEEINSRLYQSALSR